jgi:hypothetical protein
VAHIEPIQALAGGCLALPVPRFYISSGELEQSVMSAPVAGFERRGQMQDAGGGERRRRERMVSGIRELCGVAGAPDAGEERAARRDRS